MSNDFAEIFRGLMENRGLTPQAVSKASVRAESTINRLLSGRLSPRIDILRDVAPVLQLQLSDLLVIAGIPVDSASQTKDHLLDEEFGELVATASSLGPEKVRILLEKAKQLENDGHD